MTPKYKIGDTISFEIEQQKVTATIRWVDEFGTFEEPDEVCYDVIGDWNGEKTIFKHIPESMIL